MKKTILTTTALLALTACAGAPPPICDREAQAYDKFGTIEDACLAPAAALGFWPRFLAALTPGNPGWGDDTPRDGTPVDRPTPPTDGPEEPETPDGPSNPPPSGPEGPQEPGPNPDTPRGGPKGNNGFGNGDQDAPGGSGPRNNAENDAGGRADPRGRK